MLCKLVTGYCPIQGHPRSAEEYGRLGENLFGGLRGNFIVHPYYETVQETWLAKLIQKMKIDVTHSTADNPKKNTLAYHCVNFQKFGWLLKAAMSDDRPDTFVWLDYGISHIGVTSQMVNDMMSSIRKEDFAIPGCWPREGLVINDYFPCWRFCGGLLVVPRDQVYPLYKVVKREIERHIQQTRNITWEVNVLAKVEPALPIRWYLADHNASMVENYDAIFRSKDGKGTPTRLSSTP